MILSAHVCPYGYPYRTPSRDGALHVASERTSHLTSIFSQPVGRGGRRGKKAKTKFERKSCKERDFIFSLSFPTIGPSVSGEARGKSSSSRKGLRIETGVGEFRQTLGGRGFSPTWFNPCVRAIQMAWVV